MNSNNSIIGTLRDVRNNKNDKPRIEIHFKLEFENFFQEYGYTNPKGWRVSRPDPATALPTTHRATPAHARGLS